MKKSLYKIAKYAFATTILAVFLYSCANPLSDSSLSNVSGSAKALVSPTIVEDSKYKGVLQLDSDTVDTLKIDREPILGEVIGGVIEITNLYYKDGEVIGFDFVSTTPVLAVYVKAANGGNLYDYRPAGVNSDTELFTPINSSGTNAGISHVDFAWVVSGGGGGGGGGDDDDDDNEVVPTETISGFVFHDLDKDGVRDSGEAGLGNVTVTLSNGATVTTASDGSYSFTQLFAQPYTVGSGTVEGFYRTSPSSLTVTASASEVNFGFTYETISGFVFYDIDKDGVRDVGEPGFANVSVTLSNGVVVATGADGSYSVSYLLAQAYTLTSGTVEGHYRTTPEFLTVTASASEVNFGFTYETISGFVYYDSNNNGVRDFGEPALPNVNVTLDKDGTPLTVASASDGSYSFSYLLPKTYQVTVADLEGFVHSSPAVQNPLATAENVNFGFFIDYSWLNGKTANGFTIGYWKNNVDKAIANRTNGIQVSKATLLSYMGTLSSFALSPLNFPATVDGLRQASAVLSKTGSAPTDLLAKQLMGSEFNYASGAYIGGNALATYYFLYQGEYMLLNASSFSSAQLLAQKDRYDAYNNSHGGAVLF